MTKTVIANTTIHRTTKLGSAADPSKGVLAVAPEVQVIQPGTVFKTQDEREYKDFKASGAIRDAAEDAKVDPANALPEPTEAPARDAEGDEPKKIEDMKGAELDALLEKTESIEQPEGWATMKVQEKKDFLTKAFEEAAKADAENGGGGDGSDLV